MKKIFYPLALLALMLPATLGAAEPSEKKGSAVKEELKNHFGLYGFIRNYFTYDSRESASGTGNLFYYLPFDKEMNSAGEDLNDRSSFRFLAITSRVGLDVTGYRIGKTDISAKVETDFYAGLSGSTGTATLRLRQAYMKLGWNDLPMCGGNKASVTLLMGQAWHPMAADQPDVISLAVGAPFNAFNRSPQVTMDASLGKHFTITGSFIYQMQYTSNGPSGSSADYMKYGILPEVYAGLTYKTGGFLARAGVSLLSIKPMSTVDILDVNGEVATTRKASGRMTTLSPYVYLQYKHKTLSVKAKTIYGGAAEYMNLVSGYGITGYDSSTYTFDYAATRVSSSWISISAGKKIQGILMAGYIYNLGSSEDFIDADGDGSPDYYFFTKDGGNFKNMAQAFRIVPTIVYNIGKFSVGLEYELTSAQYGDLVFNDGTVAEDGLPFEGIAGVPSSSRHWVANHRVQLMTKFTF